jgi:hypothetical protein
VGTAALERLHEEADASPRLAAAEQLFMIEDCAPVAPAIDDDHFEGRRVSRTKPSTIASPPAFSWAARHSSHASFPYTSPLFRILVPAPTLEDATVADRDERTIVRTDARRDFGE